MPIGHLPRRRALVASVVAFTAFGTLVGASAASAAPSGKAHAATHRAAATPFTPVSGFTVAHPPTAAQVNAAVADGVDYLDCQQDQTAGDPNLGSFDGDVPETAAAIIAYAVLDKGDIADLPTSFDNPACPGPKRDLQTDLLDALTWLLGQQDTTDPVEGDSLGGSWGYDDFYYTYSTGLALTALGLNTDVPTLASKIQSAIALGRGFLGTPGEFEDEPPSGETGGPADCTTTPNSYTDSNGTTDTSSYCGGWNYEPEYLYGEPRSDQSNTGYAITGLHLTGGLTPEEAALNTGWMNNDQADTSTNSYYAGSHDDGGASYQPDIVADVGDDFSSNANDSGTLLYSLADDGVPISDPRVKAALQFDTDALDTYEKQANTDTGGPGYETGPHVMVFHDGDKEDGSCAPGTMVGGTECDWEDGTGEGGFHYSMFTIAKGLGAYIPADLSDGSNWYAKVADLLVAQQDTTTVCTPAQDTPCTFGSWPPDLRDDFSTIFATGLAVFTLGLVATPPPPVTTVTTVSQTTTCDQVVLDWVNPTTPNYGGVFIQRSTTGYPASPSDGTRVADAKAPAESFTDTGLVSGTRYYYALFAHDTTGQLVSGGADISAVPTCAPVPGYRLEGGDGGIFDFRQAYYGSVGFPSPPGLGLHIFNFVGIATTDKGYWLVQSNGGVFSFGDAHFEGSLPGEGTTVDDIVGIAATPDGGGYWEVSSTGTVYPFGDAKALGSLTSAQSAADRVVAILDDGASGYWLISSDGGVFAFGSAVYHGSCPQAGSGCQSLVAPVVGAAGNGAGGYWLVASDGGVFSFGDARYHGSCPQAGSACGALSTVVGIASPDAGGYWVATSNGSVYTFGDANFYGSCPQAGSACQKLVRPIVAIT